MEQIHTEEQEEILKAIAALEGQRDTLGSTAVDAAQEGLRQKLTRLKPSLLDKHAAESNHAMIGERKMVTIMFADVSGFTSLSERIDPELARRYLNECFNYLVPVIKKYGGTVGKFIGDEVMAFFGAPVAYENAEERCLLTSLEMMQAIREFNVQNSLNFKIHIGINTGLVVTGNIGSDNQQQYDLIGDAVNLASRLSDLASDGQIFVGLETYQLTAPLFDFTRLDPVKVQGKSLPVTIYQLNRIKDQPGSLRGLEAQGIHSPLVGRDAQLRSAVAQLAFLDEGTGGILGIFGEAGMGKSRLITEIHNHSNTSGQQINWMEGYTLSFGNAISYWPLQVMIRKWAGVSDEDQDETAWDKLAGRITSLFGDSSLEILPYIASLLTIEVRGEYAERVKYLDGEALGRQVFRASYRFFEKMALLQPTVLVFEDLQWIDESSSSLIEHLFPLTRSVPLLIIIISRPGRNSPAERLRILAENEYSDGYTEISIDPLDVEYSQVLIQNLLKIEQFPHGFRELVISRAEGNPFFVEEIIRNLIDQGTISKNGEDGSWRVTGQIESITLPNNIQGIIMARVDRLNEDVKQVLRVASVIGRSFLYRVLNTTSKAGKALDGYLDELIQVELISQKQSLPELEYIFKHALAQEVTYESILLQKRKQLHNLVGNAIESLFPNRLDEFYGMLAYHFARAEDWEKALDYLVKAGDQAGRVAADAEALELYQQAMDAYSHHSGILWNSVEQASLKRKIGEAFMRQGDNIRAHEYLEQALNHLGKRLPSSRTRLRQAILKELVVQVGHRLAALIKETRIKETVSPAIEEEYRIFYLMGTIESLNDEELFLFSSIRGLNFAEREGTSFGMALGTTGVGLICDFISAFRLAGYYHNRAMQLAKISGHPVPLGEAFLAYGIDRALQGKLYQSIEASTFAIENLKETGELHLWGIATESQCQVLIFTAQFSEAENSARELIRIGQEGGEEGLKCWGWLILGSVLRRRGNIDEAVFYLNQAISLAEKIPEKYSLVLATGELGFCLLHQGKLDSALEVLEPSWEKWKGQRIGNSITPLMNAMAQAALLRYEDSSPQERGKWSKKAEIMCKAARAQGKVFRGGMPEAMRLTGTYEWIRGRKKPAQRWWERSLTEAEWMKMPYEAGMIHMEIGYRTGSSEHVEAARKIFSDLQVRIPEE